MADEPYAFTGEPLTPYEAELLQILAEECNEVAIAASKLLRFGREKNPTTGVSNIRDLGLETGDLQMVFARVLAADILRNADVVEGMERKEKRLAIYMRHKRPGHPEGGTDGGQVPQADGTQAKDR